MKGREARFFLRMSTLKQLMLLLCLITVLSIGFQLLATLLEYRSRRDESREASFAIIRQTDTALTRLAQEMIRAAGTIEKDPSIQNYLYMYNHRMQQDVQQRMALYQWMIRFMGGIAESNGAFQDVAIVTQRRDIYRSSNFFQYSMLVRIEGEMDVIGATAPAFVSWPVTEPSFALPRSGRRAAGPPSSTSRPSPASTPRFTRAPPSTASTGCRRHGTSHSRRSAPRRRCF